MTQSRHVRRGVCAAMSASSGLTIALAVARLVIALVLLAYAFDWRSPLLASVRPWALAALIVLPVALILADVRALRSAAHPRGACTLNAIALGLAAASLACVLSLETDFHWTRRQVLGGDPAQLAKLGRHIMVGYRNADELHALIERRAIAGVFVAAHNVQGRSAAAIKREIAVLQEMRRQQGLPDLLIAADQEGGSVSRLSPPLAPLPPLASIVARYADPTERRRAVADYAAVHARELADLGINLNLAPVVDLTPQVVNGNDRLTRISSRAISGDPQIVTEVAETYCSQLLAHGVRCTLKHFPLLRPLPAHPPLGPPPLAPVRSPPFPGAPSRCRLASVPHPYESHRCGSHAHSCPPDCDGSRPSGVVLSTGRRRSVARRMGLRRRADDRRFQHGRGLSQHRGHCGRQCRGPERGRRSGPDQLRCGPTLCLDGCADAGGSGRDVAGRCAAAKRPAVVAGICPLKPTGLVPICPAKSLVLASFCSQSWLTPMVLADASPPH